MFEYLKAIEHYEKVMNNPHIYTGCYDLDIAYANVQKAKAALCLNN